MYWCELQNKGQQQIHLLLNKIVPSTTVPVKDRQHSNPPQGGPHPIRYAHDNYTSSCTGTSTAGTCTVPAVIHYRSLLVPVVYFGTFYINYIMMLDSDYQPQYNNPQLRRRPLGRICAGRRRNFSCCCHRLTSALPGFPGSQHQGPTTALPTCRHRRPLPSGKDHRISLLPFAQFDPASRIHT